MADRFRTLCRDGRLHAEFSVVPGHSEKRRAEEVRTYDDRQGCGPHTAQSADLLGEWADVDN